MTSVAARLARMHADSFGAPNAHGWAPADFARVADDPRYQVQVGDAGFALALVTVDEAELLLIGVQQAARGTGQGRQLLHALHNSLAQRGVGRVFLEVAADNAAARALYLSCGYRQIGSRPGYYRTADGVTDAILYECTDLQAASLPL